MASYWKRAQRGVALDNNAGSRKRPRLSRAVGGRGIGTGRLADYAEIKKNKNVLLSDIQAHLLAETSKPTDRRQDIIHPSEMAKGDWCHRATYYRLAGWTPPKDDKFSFVLQNIFAEGHEIHRKWQKWISEMGRLW